MRKILILECNIASAAQLRRKPRSPGYVLGSAFI